MERLGNNGAEHFCLDRRKAFTILETVIALALASLIIIVILSTLTNSRVHIEKDLEKLEFISEATIFLEYVKRDIRNARRTPGSVRVNGDNMTILAMNKDGKDQTILYKYKRDKRFVGRRVDEGRVKWFGRIGREAGIITDFLARPISGDDYRGFYQVQVTFMSRSDYYRQKKRGIEKPKALRTHTFQALVNRRTPDSVDDKWNSAFRD